MNQEQFQGNWQQLKGKVRQQWGKLTDNDVQESQGNMELLIGKIAESYGLTKEKASKKFSEFLTEFSDMDDESSLVSRAVDMADTVNEKVHDAAQCCQEFIKNKPFATMGIVAAAGVLVGLLLGRDRSR